MPEPAIALLDTVWTSIATLGAQLDDEQWARPTDCPGWTVKDNLSHLIGTENLLAGAPGDPPLEHRGPHVRNDIGAFNEAAVDARRGRSGADVLGELRAVTAARLAALRALPAEKWEEIGPTPTGPNTYRHFMTMRVFDSWVHEQDVRRAVGLPGHLRGPVVVAVMAWHRRNLGYVVAKRAAVADGTVVVFDVGGDEGDRIAVRVSGGRGTVGDEAGDATTTLRTDVEAYNALLCGRWTAAEALSAGRLHIDGDEAVGRRVADAMGYVF
jgi:uncharacterized protein (TIGR03083 family)